MTGPLPVDPVALREEVKSKYREVALEPDFEVYGYTFMGRKPG